MLLFIDVFRDYCGIIGSRKAAGDRYTEYPVRVMESSDPVIRRRAGCRRTFSVPELIQQVRYAQTGVIRKIRSVYNDMQRDGRKINVRKFQKVGSGIRNDLIFHGKHLPVHVSRGLLYMTAKRKVSTPKSAIQ